MSSRGEHRSTRSRRRGSAWRHGARDGHSIFTAFHCLSLRFHCLSLLLHCLSLPFHGLPQCLNSVLNRAEQGGRPDGAGVGGRRRRRLLATAATAAGGAGSRRCRRRKSSAGVGGWPAACVLKTTADFCLSSTPRPSARSLPAESQFHHGFHVSQHT